MPGLPRPEVPSGARRDLADALHALHHEAGWPSLRTLAREAGCSPTTVSTVFSSAKVPSWGVLELLVEAMGGPVEEFRRLWLAASSSDATPASTWPATRIAGRRVELATARRHLDSGTGLLLVVGEAGIGKTRLVDTAIASTTVTFVAQGACLPLSARAPLLAVTDALRSVYEVDDGQRLKDAVTRCPPYVGAVLRRLVPELDVVLPVSAVQEDRWWQQQLFAAVGATLAALAATNPTGVMLEDLHWADPATLDLVEHLLNRSPPLPLLATYRQGDPSIPSRTRDWLGRIQRLPAVTTLELGPLTRDESAEQLELLGSTAGPEEVDRIYRRSAGLPLYTEQLAQSSSQLPGRLADLLDSRLAEVAGAQWAIARALGVADRSFTAGQLQAITGLEPAALTSALHALEQRHLTTTEEHAARLRHPLLAEAVRRRLVAGEESDEHRLVATALADGGEASAVEIAEHWQLAGATDQELVWRIRAAQEVGSMFAAVQAGEHWRRALELWPEDAEVAGSPGVRRADVYLDAIKALEWADWSEAAVVAEEALATLEQPLDATAAQVYGRAGGIRGDLGDPGGGLVLVDQALAALDPTQHPAEHALILLSRHHLLRGLDRHEEAAAATALAVELSADIDPVVHRRALSVHAGYEADLGRLDQAFECLRLAADVVSDKPDPAGELMVAGDRACLLMASGRGADEVLAAGRVGLEVAEAWGVDNMSLSFLLGNMAMTLMRAGRVREAAELIDPVTEGRLRPIHWPTYEMRGMLDLLRGHAEEATRLLDELSEIFIVDVSNQVECALWAPSADLWCGRPQRAYERVTASAQDLVAVADPAADVGSLLALVARATADLATAQRAGRRERATLVHELEDLVARTTRDPFDTRALRPEGHAQRATWGAEISRLSGASSSERWAAASVAWDKLERPHDSAYCRWRGAQAALATGQGTAAARLLRRAERDAREHVPLLAAIRTTAAAPRPYI